jgi:fused signal recognition particle receptor
LDKTLHTILLDTLQAVPQPSTNAQIYLLVGINGSGKTTFAGKLAHYYATQGKRVLLVAADTFRAAASAQLHIWAQQAGVTIVTGDAHQDPSSVIFAGCSRYINEKFDIFIIDTAGRLQTKTNLMHELAKIKKVITKQLPHSTVQTLLTIDAMLGQNSFEQAALFKECTSLSGIVLTKMDSTGKGGIVFAIAKELQIPVLYVSYGEKIDQMVPFDAPKYVQELVYERI